MRQHPQAIDKAACSSPLELALAVYVSYYEVNGNINTLRNQLVATLNKIRVVDCP